MKRFGLPLPRGELSLHAIVVSSRTANSRNSTGSGRGHSARGLDRSTKKSLLVESFESLPVYFGIVSSRKDYFTLTVVSCDLQNPLGV